MKKHGILFGFLGFCMCPFGSVFGQSGSLFHRPAQANNIQMANYRPQDVASDMDATSKAQQQTFANPNSPGTMQSVGSGILPPGYDVDPSYGIQASLTYIPPSQARTIALHDAVMVRVDEAGTALMLGNATSRKTTQLDAVLSNWVKLENFNLKPAAQKDGDPRVSSLSNEVYRGDSLIRTNESLTFNIATQVVDIKPNGLLTLQGRKKITFNDNVMEVFLIGTCRAQDIDANNTLLSRNLLDLEIKRADDGHVRDGYSRGWLTKLYAKFKPF
jgi:flagellar L-ring protein precursor FlgH